MTRTYVSSEAAQRLQHGSPWLQREDIVRMEGTPVDGEPVELRDEHGERLGLGDVDLSSSPAIRRLGLPQEDPQGVVQRQLRRALARRARLLDDPRFCRVVHDDGDGLPGLLIDRYDAHFVVQTSTRAMDARVPALTRALVEFAQAESVLLRSDGPDRRRQGLPARAPHVLHGRPPRWTRVHELGGHFTVDLFGTTYRYEHRNLRRALVHLALGARVLDLQCQVGGLFLHAAIQGAREVLAFEADSDAVELALENCEANGRMRQCRVELADPLTALEQVRHPYDLVLLDTSRFERAGPMELDSLVELMALSVRHIVHGGHLLVTGYHPPLPPGHSTFDASVASACEREHRIPFLMARPGLPFDFPSVLGTPDGEWMSAAIVEVN